MKIQDQLRLMAEDWHGRIGYASACEVLSKAADQITTLKSALREALECGEDGDWQSARRVITAALGEK